MAEEVFYSLKPTARGALPTATTLSQQKVIEVLRARRVRSMNDKFAFDNLKGLEEFGGQAFGVFETFDIAKAFDRACRKAAKQLGWTTGSGTGNRMLLHSSIAENPGGGFVLYVVRVPALDSLVQRFVEVEALKEKA